MLIKQCRFRLLYPCKLRSGVFWFQSVRVPLLSKRVVRKGCMAFSVKMFFRNLLSEEVQEVFKWTLLISFCLLILLSAIFSVHFNLE